MSGVFDTGYHAHGNSKGETQGRRGKHKYGTNTKLSPDNCTVLIS